MIPIGNLLSQPILDGGGGLSVINSRRGFAHFLQMFRHQMGNGMALCLLLKTVRDPGALWVVENCGCGWLVLGQSAKVKIGRIVEMTRSARRIQLTLALGAGPRAVHPRG